MRLDDLRIGTQLRLGLGLILATVLLLGVVAWRQATALWLQTQTLYEHPLQVRRAVGALTADILAIQHQQTSLLLAEDDTALAAAQRHIETHEANAGRQFQILFERYLGPRADITVLHDDFAAWRAIRAETLRLLRAGQPSPAAERLHPSGADGRQAESLMGHLQRIDDFALAKGDELYGQATAARTSLELQLGIITVAALLLSLLVAGLLLRAVKTPLTELRSVADRFRRGQMEARSHCVTANEFGALATAFNAMADTVQAEKQVGEQAAELAAIMLRQSDLRPFCRELLKALSEHTGAQIAAVHLLNPQKTAFEHFESIGLGGGGQRAFSATAPEGEFGAALATGRTQRLTEIPADTRFTFVAVSGEFRPREIITIPLGSGAETVAMLSLASVRAFTPNAVHLLTEIQNTLTARLSGVLAHQVLAEQAVRLEQQNRELEAQKQELSAQTAELSEMNAELEMQKRQLDEASRLKSAFLSNMSHELRTPLNSVIALSGVLSRRLAGTVGAEAESYLDVIGRNGRNLLTLINDILDLSRIEAGREEIITSPFALPALVDEVVEMISPQAREKGLALTCRLGEDLPALVSDADKCRHILQNLVGNAVKFTASGSVEITARRVDREIHIAVRDTGIGIAANQLERIFDEFWQADGSAARKYGGTGLGLAIARRYATLLGGGIAVDSALGQGSTFTLRLPLTPDLPTAAISTTTAAPEPRAALPLTRRVASGAGRRILLVEDNGPAVIQMTDILADQGYEVQVARNGREALAHIDAVRPDAVILDLMMPEMDGFAVLRAIRGTAAMAHLPVLILTAKHVTRDELRFLEGNHIHQLIRKGDVSRAELLKAVARMVEPPSAPPPPPRRGRTARAHAGQALILVVEDNPDNLQTMRALLQDTYRLIEASDGQAALAQARAQHPDLILMDLALPVMDGLQALRELRADASLRDTPVLAVTASAMKGDPETILAHGFDAYISKPVDHETLLQTLRRFVGEPVPAAAAQDAVGQPPRTTNAQRSRAGRRRDALRKRRETP